MLEEQGMEIGAWLYKRHIIIENFMRTIGVCDSIILQETEKVEHTVSNDTSVCIEVLNNFFADNPDIINRFAVYRAEQTKV
jgi:Mn-dependent DtxR family transcriptional regulator